MRRYGIIGFPLAHSFSQRYFTEKFSAQQLAGCEYNEFPIESINELPALINQDHSLKGLNVTIPYKKQVLEFLHDRSAIPKGLDACNCIKIIDGKGVGFNTDIIGFQHSLQPMLSAHHKKALVLGSGGAAAAVCFVLKKLQIDYVLVSRNNKSNDVISYADLDSEIMKTHLLIINTTPLGTFPKVDACPDLPYHLLGPDHFLYDLVYNPERTLFLKKGEEAGASIKNGYEMLVIQAEESWKIWNED